MVGHRVYFYGKGAKQMKDKSVRKEPKGVKKSVKEKKAAKKAKVEEKSSKTFTVSPE